MNRRRHTVDVDPNVDIEAPGVDMYDDTDVDVYKDNDAGIDVDAWAHGIAIRASKDFRHGHKPKRYIWCYTESC